MATRTIPFTIDKSDGTGLVTTGAPTATVQYGTGGSGAATVTQRGNGWSVDVDDTQDALVIVTHADATTFGFTVTKIPTVALTADYDAAKTALQAGGNVVATNAPSAATIATAIEGALLNEADGQAVLEAIVAAINNADVDVAALSITAIASAAASAILATPAQKLVTNVSGQVEASNMVAAAPTAATIRAEIDTNSTRLATLAGRNNPLTTLQTTAAVEAATITATVDTTAIAAAVIAGMPPIADGVTITQATLGTDGDPLGRVMPYGEVTVYLDTDPQYQFDADANGDFSYNLPEGSIWRLVARRADYQDTTAEVSTVTVS